MLKGQQRILDSLADDRGNNNVLLPEIRNRLWAYMIFHHNNHIAPQANQIHKVDENDGLISTCPGRRQTTL